MVEVVVVVVVGGSVVEVVDVVTAHGIVCVIAFVQVPVDVIVTPVAASSTLTLLPAVSSLFVPVDGVTLPTVAVRLKLGPKSAPKPAPNVNVIFLAIFLFFYIEHAIPHVFIVLSCITKPGPADGVVDVN